MTAQRRFEIADRALRQAGVSRLGMRWLERDPQFHCEILISALRSYQQAAKAAKWKGTK